MPRGKRASDSAYNARRRYTRAAERYLNKAEDSVGATSDRYRALAREAIGKAAELYERKADIKRSKKFRDTASKLGVDVEEFMIGKATTKQEQERREALLSESESFTAPTGTASEKAQARRDQEARAILNSPMGSRIYAGTVDIWAQPTYDPETGEFVNRKTQDDIDQAIMDYFGVESMMDVIEILERETDIYADPESMERYDAVSLTIAAGLYR